MAQKQWRMTKQCQHEEAAVPVSPMGQYFNSSVLRVYVIGLLEFDVPFDESQAIPLLKRLFLPINPRLSSIMIEDKRGDKQWNKVEVNLKDHINIPLFLDCKSKESYDKYFADYLSRLAIEKLPESRPLWEIHIVNYPTSSAASSLIFKLHHALGDGYSLMGALLSYLQRAIYGGAYGRVASLKMIRHQSDLVLKEQKLARSAYQTMTFSIDQIKLIKSRLRVTINDVISGVIFYGTRLYMQEINDKSRAANSTALVLLNTRNIRGYQSIDDMLNAKAKGPWGNRISFLHVPIPKLENNRISNPLEFIWEAHNIIKQKKRSLAVPLTVMLLDMESKIKGYEAVAKHVHGTVTKSSTVITNLIGPSQPMSLANHPVKGLYFTLVGGPESLVISILSYMGVLRVTFKAEKYFIDEHKLNSCINSAFDIILKVAMEIPHETTSY